MAKPKFGKSRLPAAGGKSSLKSSGRTDRSNLASVSPMPPSPRQALTPRERAVLMQIGRGASSREVGEALGVSARTIEFHRANIMRKLGVKGIVDLMLRALKEQEKGKS